MQTGGTARWDYAREIVFHTVMLKRVTISAVAARLPAYLPTYRDLGEGRVLGTRYVF